jgi:hypothetical protein
MPDVTIHPASYRDPSGFVFKWNGSVYRQVNKSYADEYELFKSSGLYDSLTNPGFLIGHKEVEDIKAEPEKWYKTLLPEQIQFISYPYEWCFLQLKEAALLTLKILKLGIAHGMVLKDATPYNIQFIDGNPVFIDTLSFEKYDAGKPWVAYRQFCNMFLFPLYLEHYLNADIQKTLLVYPDGIPLDMTSRLLPFKSRARLGVWLHVYLQHTVSRNASALKDNEPFSRKKLLNLVDHLEHTIINLKKRETTFGWNNYYTESILSNEYLAEKENIFISLLQRVQPRAILDIGANDGHFSKIAAKNKSFVIAVDDHAASINKLYSEIRDKKLSNILPLVIDVMNPSPAAGFAAAERASFTDRMNTDLVAALAIIHHLVIGRNMSLAMLASWLCNITHYLIIEFVPREDEKIKQMLATRKDVFDGYTQQNFEQAFDNKFSIKHSVPVPGTMRTIYLMEKR